MMASVGMALRHISQHNYITNPKSPGLTPPYVTYNYIDEYI